MFVIQEIGMIIGVDSSCADIFLDFAKEHGDSVLPVGHKAFIGGNELSEFIVNVTPQLLTALASYLIARMQFSKKEIRIKKGELEIEIKNSDITAEATLDILKQLEQRQASDEQ